jgi:hypothetical protein
VRKENENEGFEKQDAYHRRMWAFCFLKHPPFRGWKKLLSKVPSKYTKICLEGFHFLQEHFFTAWFKAPESELVFFYGEFSPFGNLYIMSNSPLIYFFSSKKCPCFYNLFKQKIARM